MKIISYNINGMKAFTNKGGLDDIMTRFKPDLICFQETKSTRENFGFYTQNYVETHKRFLVESEYKKGYAGVGILITNELLEQVKSSISVKLGDTYEDGRILCLEFESFYLVGTYYLNSGEKDELRMEFDHNFRQFIKNLDSVKPVVIIGDLNVVPYGIDYWGNLERYRNTSPGLKDYERNNFHSFMNDLDMVDTFRQLHPTQRTFSWFSYMGNAFESNRGWRIDLAVCSRRFLSHVVESRIYDDIRYSDHCPIEIELSV